MPQRALAAVCCVSCCCGCHSCTFILRFCCSHCMTAAYLQAVMARAKYRAKSETSATVWVAWHAWRKFRRTPYYIRTIVGYVDIRAICTQRAIWPSNH